VLHLDTLQLLSSHFCTAPACLPACLPGVQIRFRLVLGTPYSAFPNPTVIAESPLVTNTISNRPQQVHLSIDENGQ
jgi:hypothetical protein